MTAVHAEQLADHPGPVTEDASFTSRYEVHRPRAAGPVAEHAKTLELVRGMTDLESSNVGRQWSESESPRLSAASSSRLRRACASG